MVSEADKERFMSVFQEHFGSVDEEAQIILKGHLLIEESLYVIISNFVFHPDALEKASLGFYQKVHVARSLSLDEKNDSMWDLILAINSVRNKIAHKLSTTEREKPMAHLRELYFKETQGEDFSKVWEEQGTTLGLAYTISLALGFLQSFEQEAQRFKQVIGIMDHTLNPHRSKTK